MAKTTTTTTTAKNETKLDWQGGRDKYRANLRLVGNAVDEAVLKTEIDAINGSNLPPKMKARLIESAKLSASKASGLTVQFYRPLDAQGQPTGAPMLEFSGNCRPESVSVGKIKRYLENAEFLMDYIAEMEDADSK